MYGLALRGFAGAGQNMYIYPSIFRGFGGSWFKGKDIVVNSPEAVNALDWYVNALTASTRRRRCATGTGPTSPTPSRRARSATYIDAHSSAAVHHQPREVQGGRQDRLSRAGRKGPNGKRVTSIWNWGFPINAALTEKQKKATWLFIQLGHLGRDAGAHLVEVRRAGQALGRQPHLAVEVARVRRRP